jgi:ABC-type transport system involved in cytochrome bd biosynthesis fused ATPase/permease subunit
MYQYAVSLESIFVDAKAMHDEYLDRLLMTVNLEQHVRSTPDAVDVDTDDQGLRR